MTSTCASGSYAAQGREDFEDVARRDDRNRGQNTTESSNPGSDVNGTGCGKKLAIGLGESSILYQRAEMICAPLSGSKAW